MSSLIFRLSRRIPGSASDFNLAHCIDQRLQVLPQVDLRLLHGESGGRDYSQVDLLIISLTAEVTTSYHPFLLVDVLCLAEPDRQLQDWPLWEPVRGR